MCVSGFSATLIWKIFYSEKKLDMTENLYWPSCEVSFSFFSDFDDSWIFSPDFEKYSDIKLDENPSSGSLVVPCGQTEGRTDKHEEANSRSSQFCERA